MEGGFSAFRSPKLWNMYMLSRERRFMGCYKTLESTGRKKATDHVPAVKKLKKSEMLGEGQFVHVKAERSLLVEVDSNSILKLCCCLQDDKLSYLFTV
ncbi:serine/threonine-protein kinase ndrA [Pyrus ussuriensis x Pyrus communis]|uniref:Serine/threonine-protein kinase ndrA n=1 Tax=Pyrus ussuriensis x Pyrus communis TaxID=2448454 RepID=A0A5N5FYH5_9ROSA|nr:serine/threonine-protein kinase ndrA [Pyrus ussuriensis x Pyrus communis]